MSELLILTFFFSVAPLFYGFYRTTIFEKTDSGTCRCRFFMENPGQARNFQYIIFKYRCVDIGLNARSLKNTEKNWRIVVLNKWALFFLRPWLQGDTVLYIQYSKKKSRLSKQKCSRGAGRYGGGTARRGAAWTSHFFHEKLYLYIYITVYTVL